MKCTRCGANVDENQKYCSSCGGRMVKEDNSKDDTLRLPDLSGVPLGISDEPRRRSSVPKKKTSSAGLIWGICAVIAVLTAAIVLVAVVFLRSGTSDIFPNSNNSYSIDPYDEDEDYGVNQDHGNTDENDNSNDSSDEKEGKPSREEEPENAENNDKNMGDTPQEPEKPEPPVVEAADASDTSESASSSSESTSSAEPIEED